MSLSHEFRQKVLAPHKWLMLALFLTAPTAQAQLALGSVQTRDLALQLEVVTDELSYPWSMAFLPDGRLLVSERAGALALVDQGKVSRLDGMPEVSAVAQGGLFDLALHPRFGDGEHDWLYFSWAQPADTADGRYDATTLSRVWFDGTRLGRMEHLFMQNKPATPGKHYGGRMVWLQDGTLILSVGERDDPPRSQDPGDHAGSLIHLDELGKPQTSSALPDAAPGVYSMGHRNPQGLALAPDGILWSSEHGPRTGDELNHIVAGENYGWPEVTLGRDYATNQPIGRDSAPGMRDPVHVFEGRFAPSGLAVVTSEQFPQWQGDLLAGGLRSERLIRLQVSQGRVVDREVILDAEVGRIRDVRQGPDGSIYLLTDADPGRLLRLRPETSP